jgi:hypothetical protein
MPFRFRFPALPLTLFALATATAALAGITLTTDQPAYVVGDIVHITAHNNGPDLEQFMSDPFFFIHNDDLDECVFGCVGLPVITPFEVGATVSMDWDAGFFPDAAGNYSVSLATASGPTVSYILNAPVSTETSSWGRLKALFR